MAERLTWPKVLAARRSLARCLLGEPLRGVEVAAAECGCVAIFVLAYPAYRPDHGCDPPSPWEHGLAVHVVYPEPDEIHKVKPAPFQCSCVPANG